MKASKFLLSGVFMSVCATLSFFTSCTDNEFEPYKEVLVIASEIVEKSDANAFWVKRNGSDTWEMMYSEIANFNHQRGYEYVVEVSVKKVKDPGPDQSNHSYTLIRIISKEKKDSTVKLYDRKVALVAAYMLNGRGGENTPSYHLPIPVSDVLENSNP